MIFVEAVMLTCMLFFGGYCAITDLGRGIVSNKLIAIGFLVGIALHVALLILGLAPYYLYWFINLVIAYAIAFGMYLGKLWAAGDAKLFMLLFFLAPVRLLDSGTLSHSIAPFIFIFVPGLIWMIGDSFIRIIKQEARKYNRFSAKSFFLGFLFIVIETTAFHGVFAWLLPDWIDQQALFFAAIMIAYAFLCGTLAIMKRWYIVVSHAVVILILWICNQWAFSLPSWQTYLIMAMIFTIQRFCSLYNYQYIPTNEVKAGMIPSAETVLIFKTSRVHSLPNDLSEELTAKISEEQALAIHRWGKSAKGQAGIWIVRKVPFAIMIYIGFIGWILIRILGR